MRVELLTIGDELCRGEIVDGNGAWLAAGLWELELTVVWMTSCRDVDEDLRQALVSATERADLVLTSGGLGPTEDDRTVDVISALLGVSPEIDEPARQRLHDRFATPDRALSPLTLRQVRVPAGARVFANPVGLAPGFEVALNGVPVISMPGVPNELRGIFDGGVRERLLALRQARGEDLERVARRVYRVFGMGESNVAGALAGLVDGVAGASLHYQAVFPEVLVKVVVRDRDPEAARGRLDALDAEVRSRLGRALYGTGDDHLAVVVGQALAAAGATVATAESCTGGMIGALLTDVAGSSAYFPGGAITYSNEEKTRQLGVSPELLAEHGAVSEACVKAMAEGARGRFGTDYAVAVSGVAGPGGGSEAKPVGTVWLAVAGPGFTRARRMFWTGDRARIRCLAAHWALTLVLRAVRGEGGDDDA
ncbi:CinA family nicotinamide mononucleotide deamidase-related protein [Haliangium sp.]|uniref:CinA family nicotinamide mononucleotide deamidase-related protein n=1 Tax=Haliangium sp. TaxID=2663208 RepID=UPI003D0B6718